MASLISSLFRTKNDLVCEDKSIEYHTKDEYISDFTYNNLFLDCKKGAYKNSCEEFRRYFKNVGMPLFMHFAYNEFCDAGLGYGMRYDLDDTKKIINYFKNINNTKFVEKINKIHPHLLNRINIYLFWRNIEKYQNPNISSEDLLQKWEKTEQIIVRMNSYMPYQEIQDVVKGYCAVVLLNKGNTESTLNDILINSLKRFVETRDKITEKRNEQKNSTIENPQIHRDVNNMLADGSRSSIKEINHNIQDPDIEEYTIQNLKKELSEYSDIKKITFEKYFKLCDLPIFIHFINNLLPSIFPDNRKNNLHFNSQKKELFTSIKNQLYVKSLIDKEGRKYNIDLYKKTMDYIEWRDQYVNNNQNNLINLWNEYENKHKYLSYELSQVDRSQPQPPSDPPPQPPSDPPPQPPSDPPPLQINHENMEDIKEEDIDIEEEDFTNKRSIMKLVSEMKIGDFILSDNKNTKFKYYKKTDDKYIYKIYKNDVQNYNDDAYIMDNDINLYSFDGSGIVKIGYLYEMNNKLKVVLSERYGGNLNMNIDLSMIVCVLLVVFIIYILYMYITDDNNYYERSPYMSYIYA